MVTNALNSAGSREVLDHGAGHGAVDLVLVAEGATGDAENFGNLGLHLSPALLVEEDVVVELILYLDLGQ